MTAVRSFTLPHYEAYPVQVALFKDVRNAGFLRSQLLAANPEFDYAFLDAAMVSAVSTFPIPTPTSSISLLFSTNARLDARLVTRPFHFVSRCLSFAILRPQLQPRFSSRAHLSLVSLRSKPKSLLPWHEPSINVQLHQRRHNACSQHGKIGTLARQDGILILLAAVALFWPFLLFAPQRPFIR